MPLLPVCTWTLLCLWLQADSFRPYQLCWLFSKGRAQPCNSLCCVLCVRLHVCLAVVLQHNHSL